MTSEDFGKVVDGLWRSKGSTGNCLAHLETFEDLSDSVGYMVRVTVVKGLIDFRMLSMWHPVLPRNGAIGMLEMSVRSRFIGGERKLAWIGQVYNYRVRYVMSPSVYGAAYIGVRVSK